MRNTQLGFLNDDSHRATETSGENTKDSDLIVRFAILIGRGSIGREVNCQRQVGARCGKRRIVTVGDRWPFLLLKSLGTAKYNQILRPPYHTIDCIPKSRTQHFGKEAVSKGRLRTVCAEKQALTRLGNPGRGRGRIPF